MPKAVETPSFVSLGPLPVAESNGGNRRKALWLGLALICLVAVSAVAWVGWSIQAKEAEVENSLRKRLDLIASSRTEVISTWLSGLAQQGDRVIQSDLFRLYAAEVDLIDKDISYLVGEPFPGRRSSGGEVPQLAAQLPMMQELLLEFTRYAGFLGGRIVNRTGQAYIATDAVTTPLSEQQLAYVKQALASPRPYFSPLRNTPSGLVLDMFLPIFPPEGSSRTEHHPVAVLMLSRSVSDRINELLAGSALTGKGERTRLVQKSGSDFVEVVPWLPEQLTPVGRPVELDAYDRLPFAVRQAVRGDSQVYSVGLRVPDLEWWVIEEAEYKSVREDLLDYSRTLSGLATLLIAFFGISFGAVWFRLVGLENRRHAQHFERLARQIEEQRALLDSINNTIADAIGLKDLRGCYQYVNPAFARAVGREPAEMVGLDDGAIFGFDTARRLEHSDQQVLAEGRPMTLNEQIHLQGELRYLQISKVPFRNNAGRMAGLVSVVRDVTEMAEIQKRHEKSIRQTIEALVRAIEQTDPYLAGHSRRMGAFAAEIARVLSSGDATIATVETAANLSQIGKIYIEKSLLQKADALTAEEKRELERHVERAAEVLRDIDFDLPVFEAVCQMNEHLDGSGYPRGLRDGDIALSARILAVANSFCAMVEPRSYRAARKVEEALSILADATDHYDAAVIRALHEVVHSPTGEKLLAGGAGQIQQPVR